MATIKVALVGAAGETGQSIVNGLLESEHTFQISAIVRPSSLTKPANVDLQNRGVNLISASLTGPQDELIIALSGHDVVISTISFASIEQEIPLANAAKRAGVKRFVPSGWAPVIPPAGVMVARELKEKILSHVLMLGLPYTFIDVGWWYEVTLPPVPSGRLDYCIIPSLKPTWDLGLDGNVSSAMTHVGDIGKWVAKIIADPRTLNRKVFAYNEVLTRNQVYDILERRSGEEMERRYVSEEEAINTVQTLTEAWKQSPGDINAGFALAMGEYFYSWGIRGDNRPEFAKYLGYLDCRELYPDQVSYRSFDEYVQEALEGKAKRVLKDW
ncbi:isoflavone reductase family protein [Talaromyces proteolyticus]|uniref:Isoflavone reductase family protein n=1 Tax=Talaromyces proteolyticus TaxID=1131652 RepID=A0AAD4KKL5_9EURO|nr:isoflavone reductase family protein [Talaromyces proteolyticus]KAH8691396.1 isoflavone reductase family protein [Talaromyces proteolyticus]